MQARFGEGQSEKERLMKPLNILSRSKGYRNLAGCLLYPRMFQIDAVVGHGDSPSHPSHFIALNLNGQILVIEIPGGNAAKAIVYIGPRLFGAGQDLDPVTLSFESCTTANRPDLNIHIQGSDKVICFPNNGKTFDSTSQQH